MNIRLQRFLSVLLGLALLCGVWQDSRAASPLAETLQTRINNAADGATLDILAGTYTENLVVTDKNITLRGAGRTTTILQAANPGQRVISATSDKGLRLENLTIRGGQPASSIGGGVYAAGGTLQIVNCLITDNSADYGGGVFLDGSDSSLVLSNSQVQLNQAVWHGGGVYAAGSATLYQTSFLTNSANFHGGGLHVQAGATGITGGVFSDNHAGSGNGGAVNVNNALTISQAQFSGNTAGDLGGAVSQWNLPALVSISDSDFSDNSAISKGGAAYIAGSLTLARSGFTSNTVDSGGDEDVYGGGVYAGGTLQVDRVVFSGNQAICQFCSFNCGGGLHSDVKSGTVTVTDSRFDGNEGWFGGGLSARTTVSVSHSSFTDNQGGYGAGIDAPILLGDWLLFQDNHVVNFGGGVDANDLTLAHSRFIHNSASKGGALRVHQTLHLSSNLLFAENSATAGAALLVDSGATATLYNATIARPAQAAGPAIQLEANAALNLFNSILTNYTNAITFAGSGTLTEDYNLFYNNNYDVVGGTVISGGHSTRLLPPGFVDPAGGNYHLQSNSNAIGAGHNYGLTDDLDGRPRSFGRNDAGAYQYWAFAFVPLIRK